MCITSRCVLSVLQGRKGSVRRAQNRPTRDLRGARIRAGTATAPPRPARCRRPGCGAEAAPGRRSPCEGSPWPGWKEEKGGESRVTRWRRRRGSCRGGGAAPGRPEPGRGVALSPAGSHEKRRVKGPALPLSGRRPASNPALGSIAPRRRSGPGAGARARGRGRTMSDTRRRVKVYTLNEDRQWDDRGTGHVSSTYVERLKGMSLLVRAESDGESVAGAARRPRPPPGRLLRAFPFPFPFPVGGPEAPGLSPPALRCSARPLLLPAPGRGQMELLHVTTSCSAPAKTAFRFWSALCFPCSVLQEGFFYARNSLMLSGKAQVVLCVVALCSRVTVRLCAWQRARSGRSAANRCQRAE